MARAIVAAAFRAATAIVSRGSICSGRGLAIAGVELRADPRVGPREAVAQGRRRLPAEQRPDQRVVAVAAADAFRRREIVAALERHAGDAFDDRDEAVDGDHLAAAE